MAEPNIQREVDGGCTKGSSAKRKNGRKDEVVASKGKKTSGWVLLGRTAAGKLLDQGGGHWRSKDLSSKWSTKWRREEAENGGSTRRGRKVWERERERKKKKMKFWVEFPEYIAHRDFHKKI